MEQKIDIIENEQIKGPSKKPTNETDKPQIKKEKYHMEIKRPKKKKKYLK